MTWKDQAEWLCEASCFQMFRELVACLLINIIHVYCYVTSLRQSSCGLDKIVAHKTAEISTENQ